MALKIRASEDSMRANRLFLVIVNTNNYFASWQLKRAKQLLAQRIGEYLDRFADRPIRKVMFKWEGSTYSAISDALIITPTGQ